MRKELDDQLCEKYPKIFADRNRPMTETAMGWGFQCGDGWFHLIDTLCAQLQVQTDRAGAPQVVAQQVKEKFGKLCFYGGVPVNDIQRGMINMAEALSGRICEICGAPGERRRQPGNWVTTRCAAHCETMIHALE